MAEIHPNVPAHLRENLERFAKGCDACGAMSWFAKRAATDAGIGSEGHVAIEEGRRFVGVELKRSYWRQACANLGNARDHRNADLFAGGAA